MAAALAGAATYVLVPRKFDSGEYSYYVALDVQAHHLGCPFLDSDTGSLQTITEMLQTWVKFRGDAAAIQRAARAKKNLDEAVAIDPIAGEDCARISHELQSGYERVLTTLGKGK